MTDREIEYFDLCRRVIKNDGNVKRVVCSDLSCKSCPLDNCKYLTNKECLLKAYKYMIFQSKLGGF